MTTDKEKRSGKSIVLVGLMGAGKTSVGRNLSQIRNMTFIDADDEIAKAAGRSIEDIFEDFGEDDFRDLEKKVIRRLLDEGPAVLATGGGAFMNAGIRKNIAKKGVSVWLRADLDVLVQRTRRRGGRPLLKGKNNKIVLEKLIEERYPVYAEADIIIDSKDEGPEATARSIASLLNTRQETPSLVPSPLPCPSILADAVTTSSSVPV